MTHQSDTNYGAFIVRVSLGAVLLAHPNTREAPSVHGGEG